MDTFVQKAHFLRRITLGGKLEELNSRSTPQILLSQWLSTPPKIAALPQQGFQSPEMLRLQRRDFSQSLLNQIVSAENPLHERIVGFWRDHFVVSLRKVRFPQLLSDYERILRTYALGDFQELLWQVTISPAMLSYLDGRQNRQGKINENFSREVMELFTIGRGQYREQDIQEGARALTGWTIQFNRQTGTLKSIFRAYLHDRTSKNFLGKTGNFKAEDIVAILANHPQTGRFLGGKLWSALVYPKPEPAIIDRLAKVYQNSNRNIAKVVEAILTSPEFYSAKAYRSQIRSPLEFLLGAVRQLEISADGARSLIALRSMGQLVYNPPTVKGWTDDRGWLTAPSLLTRLNLSQQLTLNNGDAGGFRFNAQRFTKQELITLLLDGKPDQNLLANIGKLSVPETAALFLSTPLYQLF